MCTTFWATLINKCLLFYKLDTFECPHIPVPLVFQEGKGAALLSLPPVLFSEVIWKNFLDMNNQKVFYIPCIVKHI